MKNTKKRGFTIVELVIVIAVIAVLAAVLIPTFANLVNKAKGSNDETFVANANKVLKAEETIEGKLSVLDAMDVLFENGMDNSGFVASNEEQAFAWDRVSNTLVLMNKANRAVVYPKDVTAEDPKEFFVLVSDVATMNEISKNHTNSYVFVNKTSDGAGLDLTGDGENIAFYAPEAEVTLKGTYGTVDAIVKGSSLHIAGTVNYLNLEKGRVVVEANAEVKVVNVIDPETGKNYEGVKLEKNAEGTINVLFVKGEASALQAAGTIDTAIQNAITNNDLAQSETTEKTGIGTEADPWLVKDFNALKMYAKVGGYLKFTANITAEGTVELSKDTTIDMNGKTVTAGEGLNVNSGKNFVFKSTANVIIQNGTIVSTVSRGISASAGELTLKNIKATTFKRALMVDNAIVTVDKDCVIEIGENGIDAPIVVWGTGDYKVDNITQHATVHVYGTVDATKAMAGYAAVTGNGGDKSYTYMYIYDGAVLKSNGVAIYAPQAGEVHVSGGTLTGYSAIGIKSGKLNITGGTLHATGEYVENLETHGSGINEDGSVIVVDSNGGYAGEVAINISGNPVFESDNGHAIREIGKSEDTTSVVSIAISGGTFQTAKDAINARVLTDGKINISGGTFTGTIKPAHVAEGYEAKDNKNGTFTVQPIAPQA